MAHDVGGLDVPVQGAGLVDGSEGPANVETDADHFAFRERPVGVQPGFEGLASNELRPNPEAPVVSCGAVYGQNIGMVDLRQQPALFDDSRIAVRPIGSTRAEQFERHLAVEPAVPRPVDVAEGPLPDALEEPQRPPRPQRVSRGFGLFGLRRIRLWAPMNADDFRQDLKLPDDRLPIDIRARFGPRAIRGSSVEYRPGDIREVLVVGVIPHGALTSQTSFRPPVGRARAARLCAPPPQWACPGPRRVLHRRSPAPRER